MKRLGKQLLAPVLLLLLWQAASGVGLTNALFFPPPTRLFAAAWRLVQAGTLQRDLIATIGRTMAAFLIGSAAGIAFGLTLSLFRGVRTAVRPMLSAALATPKITLLPLFMLLFGLGERARLMPAAATCFVVCTVHAMDAALGIDRRFVELARNYGAGRWAQVRYVFLPASLPRLFTGLRIALGTVLVLTVSAEMLSAETGIGGMIWMGWQTLSVENLLVGVIAASLLGLLFQLLLDRLERALIPWSRIATLTALLLLLSILPRGLHAQTTGALEGTVVDPSGQSVPNAKLELREKETGLQRTITADSQAHYTFSGLPPGEYDLETSYTGFGTQSQRAILVSAGASVHLNVKLQIGNIHDVVVVQGETPLLSVSPADWGGSITAQKLDSLPLNGRDMFDLAAQEPGTLTTTQTRPDLEMGLGVHLSVNDLRPSQNGFRIDGIYVDDATGSAPASSGGRTLGIEGTEELRLITSPFSAEYGRAAGAILTSVSKSGTNQWHGSAYEYLRNSAMDARNYFDPQTIPPFRRNQFGGLLSGPVKTNRLFFLVNYEGIRQYSAQSTVATTLSDAGRTGNLGTQQVTVASSVLPFLAAYPRANGPQFSDGTAQFLGTARSPTAENYVAGKMDALLSERWKFASRVTWDNGSTASQDLLQTVALNSNSQYVFAHNELQFLESPAVIHTFRAGFSRILNSETTAELPGLPSDLSFIPGQTMGALAVTGLTETGGSVYLGRPRHIADNDIQLGHQMNYIRGRHTILAGSSFDRIQVNIRADQDAPGTYHFNSLALFLTGKASSFDFMTANSDTSRGFRNVLFTGFLQDTWRLTRHFQLMAGIRYEAYSVPTEVNGKTATLPNPLHDTTATVGGPLFRNPSKANFAPRVAAAWDVDGKGKTVFRVGAGIFYDLITSRDLLVAGVRMPPYYVRPVISSPVFPNAAATLNSATQLLAASALTYTPQQSYVIQLQASFEHQLSANTLLEVAYAGGRGIHLMGYIGNVDNPTPAFNSTGTPYYPVGAPLLNPAFATIAMHTTQFDSYSHSLQASIKRRMAHGIRFEGNYAFSKSLDDDSSPVFNDFLTSDLVPVFHLRDNRGRSDYDVRHNGSVNASWIVPTMRRNAFTRFLTAWQLHGLMRLQSGFPFNPVVGFDHLGIGSTSAGGGQRPNYIAPPGTDVIRGNQQQWFNPADFGLPATGFYGNLGRNVFSGPGMFNVDLAVHKTLWARERERITLRLDAFNITNHVNFQVPSGLAVFNSSGSLLSSAGTITATATSSRQLQLALRMDF